MEEETPTRAKEEAKQQGRSSALKAPSKSFNASTPVSKDPSHYAQICSPNFTNISAIKKKEEVKDVRRMLATPEGRTHSCPEAKTQFTELFNGTFNRFLVHFVHIFQNCKA